LLLGRAPLYGVAANGLAGAAGVLALMMDEMLIAMRLLGCQTLADLGPAFIGNANDVVNHGLHCRT
ncbi:alpha-hydroxy-acid oxidizing protein, partial [Caballeronia sp. M23-90]